MNIVVFMDSDFVTAAALVDNEDAAWEYIRTGLISDLDDQADDFGINEVMAQDLRDAALSDVPMLAAEAAERVGLTVMIIGEGEITDNRSRVLNQES